MNGSHDHAINRESGESSKSIPKFTHGKSDIDPAIRPIEVFGRKVFSVYLAGTCEPHMREQDGEGNWRQKITEVYFVGHKEEQPKESLKNAIRFVGGMSLNYAGPWIEYDHCYDAQGPHGTHYCSDIFAADVAAIGRADFVFAWIDRLDTFGTMAEIAFAAGRRKVVAIAGPKDFKELWFVYRMATNEHLIIAPDPRTAFEWVCEQGLVLKGTP